MKTKEQFRQMAILALNLVLVASAAALVGCKSTGYESGNKTAASIQKAADQIGALPGQIDTTLASLSDLVEKPQPDLRPQFKQFSSNLTRVESTAKDIAGARKAMAERGDAFFAKWDEQLAQIKNEDIKARSQSRKEEVQQKLMAIKGSYAEAETAFKPFIQDLKDTQKYLSTDLTPAGVEAIKDTVTKAKKDAEPLNKSITKLADDFKALGVSMSSVTPQPPAQ